MKLWLLALIASLGLAAPAMAQPQPSAELRAGIEQVAALLRGQGAPEQMFTVGFLAQVPPARIQGLARELRQQYGAVRSIGRIAPQSPQAGIAEIELERGTVSISLIVDPAPPYRINTLFFTGAEMRGDSLAAMMGDLRALPGQVSVAVARLGESGSDMLAAHEPDRVLAIGSAFKLWILAELSREVGAGERRWSDVVALDRRSTPGGTLYNWPRGAPVTLHTLAALMISQSDNSATDVLLHVLGREKVERMMAVIGVGAAARNRPLLSTLDMAALKTGPAAGLEAWLRADEAGRRRMLEAAGADRPVDLARFTGGPLQIDSVEWFASAADLVRTMDWLRRNGDETARAILAINPGTASRVREGVAYLGYKGGSEPGVLNLSWLVRSRAGAWYAVVGSWNNPAAAVDEARFGALMARAIQLAR